MSTARRTLGLTATVVALLLAATVPAVAGWSLRLGARTEVGVAALHASVAFTPVTETFRNDRFQVTTLATVTHDTPSPGHQEAVVTTTFASRKPSTPLAGVTSVAAWPVSSPAECTETTPVPAGAPSANWDVGVTMPGVPLAVGASQSYCLRSWLDGAGRVPGGTLTGDQRIAVWDNVASPSGERTLVPQATMALALHTLTGTSTGTTVIATQAMYPYNALATGVGTYYRVVSAVGDNVCLDVTGGITALAGSALGTHGCYAEATLAYHNQQFRMSTSILEPKTALVVARAPVYYLHSNGPAATYPVTVQTLLTISAQRWQPQVVDQPTLTFQIVHPDNGLCITRSAIESGPVSLQPCTGSPMQLFTWVEV